ncbi:glycoside hydrolase family 3 N-terminal domain-containing protein [Pontiellaceae bacterium B12219]|nr:glycoside hydrolase family 3 N-terminal domain-containing protein [Pontiellaceae bacterium B12219]
MLKIKSILLSSLALAAGSSPAAPDRSELNAKAIQQATELVRQMTLDEKINLIEMENLPIERLNIPGHYWWNEALHGVARRGKATQFPIALSMASTWNPELIHEMATAISDEARALHHADSEEDQTKRYHGLTIWSPVINMARDPRWGRTEESYGEDPYLTAELACGFISGLQGDDPNYLKTVATIKHFVANNTEHNRLRVRPDISERALREYYFPAFRDSIMKEDAQSIMTAYNGINGIPCSANKWLLTDVLRNEWGFTGTVVTDVGVPKHMIKEHKYAKDGAESAAMMIKAGVDVYSGSDTSVSNNERKWALEAIEQGLLTEEELDQSVIRGLATRIKLGLLRPEGENPYENISIEAVGSEKHLALARRIAQEGAVLLQNKNNVLPATPQKYKRILFAGPYVNEAPLGGYSGTATRTAATPMLGMKAVAGDSYEIFSQHGGGWLPIPEGNLNLPGDKNSQGVKGEYFIGGKCTGKPAMTRTDPTVYLELPKKFSHIDPAIPAQDFGARWTARLTPNRTGYHHFSIAAHYGAAVWLNGEKVIDIWSHRAPDEAESKGIYLEAGQPADLRVEFYNRGGAPEIELKWIEPATEKRNGNPAEEFLVYVGGLTHAMARESRDLMDLSLPADQMAEIRELAAVYPNMLVVLNGGTVMELAELAAVVPSILLQWFPGQEGGYALADIITGACNPAGRLPLTFYTDSDKLPDFEDYEISKGRTYMYATDNVTYPFGYGLSYTSFDYTGLKVAQNKTHIKAVVNVTNSGAMDGDEVVQLYVSNQGSKVDQPIRQLKAFKRVTVPQGETVPVEMLVKKDDLAWWDEKKQQYVVNPGLYKIQIGKSSDDICAEQMIKIR